VCLFAEVFRGCTSQQNANQATEKFGVLAGRRGSGAGYGVVGQQPEVRLLHGRSGGSPLRRPGREARQVLDEAVRLKVRQDELLGQRSRLFARRLHASHRSDGQHRLRVQDRL